MTAAASHVDASPLYQKADEMQYTRHKQVVTYNGPCLVLRDNEPPRPFIHPHNKTAFRSLREMVGLDEDGMPMATPAWHCSRRRHHGCDAPRFRTCLDAQERAHRAQLQRLRRVLLARASQRRARQQQGRLRRRGPPKPVWEEARCRGVDRDLERGLRAAAAAATAAAAAGEEGGGGGRPWIAEAVERTLNRPGEAEKRLREPFRVRLLRLAAPQAVRKMPWTEGYGGSQDHLTCDKNWINLLRTLDWQAEAALKKRRDRQAELAAAKQARKARRDAAAAAAAVDGAAPTPTPPQAAAATSGRGGGGSGGGGGGGGGGVPRSRTPSSARDGSAQADAAWAAAHTEGWVRQTGRLTPPPTPQTPRGPRGQPSSGGGGEERSGVVREQGHVRVSAANLMAATKSVQEAAMARVKAAPMAPRPPPGCSDKGSRGEGPRRPRSASSVVSSRHLLKQKILEITSFATV